MQSLFDGMMLSIGPPMTETYQNQPHLAVSTRTNRDDRPSIATPTGVDARSRSACSARRMARHAVVTAIQVAEAQAAATATAASALDDPENR